MKSAFTAVTLGALLLCAPARLHAAKTPVYPHDPATIANRTRELLQQARFQELEAWAAQMRVSKKRFPSGKWELAVFYSVLSQPDAERPADADWNASLSLLRRWSQAIPDSPTADIALAKTYIGYAGHARGSGLAGTVTEKAWQLFGQRLEEAAQILDQVAKRRVVCPEYYHARVQLTALNGAGREVMLDCCRRGLEAEPSYPITYETAAWFLQDKWLGNTPTDWIEFAEQCMATTPEAYGRIIGLLVFQSHEIPCYDQGLFEVHGLSYDRVKQSYSTLVKAYPKDLAFKHQYCRLAVLAGDRNTAATLFRSLGRQGDDGVWLSQAHYDLWRNWALQSH